MLARRVALNSAHLNDDLGLLPAHHLALWSLIQSNEIKWNRINPSEWVSGPSIHVMTSCWTVRPSNMLLKEHDRYVSFNLIDLLRPLVTFQWKFNKSASWNGSELHCFHTLVQACSSGWEVHLETVKRMCCTNIMMICSTLAIMESAEYDKYTVRTRNIWT